MIIVRNISAYDNLYVKFLFLSAKDFKIRYKISREKWQKVKVTWKQLSEACKLRRDISGRKMFLPLPRELCLPTHAQSGRQRSKFQDEVCEIPRKARVSLVFIVALLRACMCVEACKHRFVTDTSQHQLSIVPPLMVRQSKKRNRSSQYLRRGLAFRVRVCSSKRSYDHFSSQTEKKNFAAPSFFLEQNPDARKKQF